MSADLADHAVHVQIEAEALAADLRTWSRRSPSWAGAGIRVAANRAVDSIDAMITELHAIRQQLVSQIRSYDDESNRRVDKLLADLHKGRAE